jgi:subfamily B ATP-binding cassette protein MsbA
MISIAEEVKKKLQFDMIKSLINADLQVIHKKHSGKFISNLTYDVNHILLIVLVLGMFKFI